MQRPLHGQVEARMVVTEPRIQSLGASPSIAMMLYAIPGYGKTRFAGSGDNTLIIRPPTDHTDSIRGGSKRNVKEWVVRNWDDMNDVYMYAQHEGEQWDWIWLDSISLFQDQGLQSIWQQVIQEKPHRARYGLDKGEYGINMQRLNNWVSGMVSLGTFNFGVTAHPFWGANLEGEELLMPYVQGRNMPEKICGMMNVVGYMDIKKLKLPDESKSKKRRVVYFNATDRYYAKDQFDAFPDGKLVDPTIPALMEAVEAARAREAAPKKKATTKGRKTKRSK